MKLIQFNQEGSEAQAEILRTKGALVASRTIGENKILLYQIDAFYIELFDDKYEQMKTPIRILRTFEEINFLDPYLKKIKIEIYE